MQTGKVYLVGAGPGDPGLMTVRGLEVLRGAGVVVYDQLVSPEILEQIPAGSLRIYAGKEAGRHSIPQEQINNVLIRHARHGQQVVRLKGGDPFVFGRGGEEAQALAEAGIPFEIVPGVSSAVAVPAYAGIPLTQRNVASSFAVVTGHEALKTHSAVDWAKLATAVDTLVVLMGLHNISKITAKLIAHGRSPETPAAVIRCGTTDRQEAVFGTLADIVEKSESLKPPALIVIGNVVSLSTDLSWFGPALGATTAERCDSVAAYTSL